MSIPFDLAGNGLDQASDVLIQPDGKIVVTGTVQSGTQDFDFAAVRLHMNGSLDTSFGSGGKVHVPFSPGFDPYDECAAAALQSDGKILLVGSVGIGSSGDQDFGVMRLLSNGSLDSSFGWGGKKAVHFDLVSGGLDQGFGIALDSSGRILVAGTASGLNNEADFAVACLLSSGAYDTTFDYDGRAVLPIAGGTGFDAGIDIAPAPNGKILVAGRAYVNSLDDADYAVVRLHDDGAFDHSFGSLGIAMAHFDLGQTHSDVLSAMALQLTGSIVVVGSVQRSSPGDFDWGVARLVGEPFFTLP